MSDSGIDSATGAVGAAAGTGGGHAPFVHLRTHSAYSLLEGAIPIKAMPALCLQYRMPALAITDTGNMFGALEFSETLAEAGIQPIIGTAIAVADEPDEGGPPAYQSSVTGNGVTGGGARSKPPRLVLLAQSETGYRNLMKLSSLSYLATEPGADPHVGYHDVARHADGLICLTGGADGPVGRLLAIGQDAAARDLIGRLAEMFPGRLYVELQRHGMEAEEATEEGFIEIAYDLDLPLVATNEPYFVGADVYEAHDALICIAEGGYVNQEERRHLTPDHRFKSPDEMRALFADLPEAIDNTIEIARRCHFRPQTAAPILPRYESGMTEEDEAAELRRQAEEGLKKRLAAAGANADEKDYWDRLYFEIDVIVKMGFPGYFLIVSDFIKWAKARDIPVGPGRGSGAASVVAWSLMITDLDPLRFNLLFERFLNPERVSMPDFDIDFCQERRDEVIRYVQDKYGHDQVAQIITFGKLQARAVLRDVGRVLQLPYGQVDRLCKLVPNNPANPTTLQQAIATEPRLQQARDEDETVAKMLDIGRKLEGLYRHASTHAAGVVIGDRPLDELVPLYRDPRSEMPVTQFNMKWVEPAGLVKFDFLGLKTLSVIQRTVDLLKRRGIEVDIAHLPLDDEKTYRMLRDADTTGVFQVEGSGMRDVLRRSKPGCFEDLIALVALFRPGPMDNIPKYCACKNGEEEPDDLHPMLQPVLEETYGVIVYQEQVMQIAQVLSGYSLGEADLLRRAMGKKIKSEMKQQKERFVEGAVARGVEKQRATYIFELVDKFAGYGFNKAHAAGYALVAYQTAYLKANHPVEFLAASMTFDMGNADKLNQFRQELQRLEITLNPPDINRSEAGFVVEKGEIHYALAAIKNVGRQAMTEVVEERKANGPYRDVMDFARRMNPRLINKRTVENLARAGAFDELNPNRAQVFHAADLIVGQATASAAERESNQVNLFGDEPDGLSGPALPAVEDWPPMERLKYEFEALGLYMSAHPLDDYETSLRRKQIVKWSDFAARLDEGESSARLAGSVVARQERRTRQGNPFAYVRLADQSGEYEVTFFSEVLGPNRDLLEPGELVVVDVSGRIDGGQARLTAQRVQPIDKATANAAAGLKIFADERTPLERVKARLEKKGRGVVNLVLIIDNGRREVEMTLPGGYSVTPQVRGAVKAIPGVLDVQEI